MNSFKIVIASQYVQVLKSGGKDIARISNIGGRGNWIAHKVTVANNGVLENVGDGVSVSNIINRQDAADLIADKLAKCVS